MFDSRVFAEQPDGLIAENEFRTVELAIAFKRIKCYSCDNISIYKYRVKEIRRSPAPEISPEVPPVEEVSSEFRTTIPRFAQIPETVKCKRCGEVLGLFPFCVF